MGRSSSFVPAVAVVVCVAFVVATLGGVAGVGVPIFGSTGTPNAEQQPESVASVTDVQSEEFDRTQIRVEILASGDAIWTFRYKRPIADEDEREGFERFADRFRSEETELYENFQERAAGMTTAGAEATGRSMDAVNFSRAARIEYTPDEVGVVEMRFRWTGFARVEDDRVHAGDVFEGGLFLSEEMQLIFEPGEGLQFVSIAPEAATSGTTVPDSESVTWFGEQSFADRHPRAVLEPIPTSTDDGATDQDTGVSDTADADDVDGTDTSDDAADDDSTTDGPTDTRTLTAGWLAIGGLGLLLLLAAVLALRRYDVIESESSTTVDSHPEPNVTDPPDPSASADTEASTEPKPDDDVADETLLSDEERVVRLLEARDGRMKQSAIVDETEWSKSKVSMLLSDMESNKTISKIQVGRENIIALEGHEPDAVGSPFDDDE